MVSFTSFVVAATAFSSVLAAATNGTLSRRGGTGNSAGTNNGYYYQVSNLVCISFGILNYCLVLVERWWQRCLHQRQRRPVQRAVVQRR
jgi:hypothetical protein